MTEPRHDPTATEHRDVAFDPGTVEDDVRSEDEELDPIDRASADSFPSSDPPAGSSPIG